MRRGPPPGAGRGPARGARAASLRWAPEELAEAAAVAQLPPPGSAKGGNGRERWLEEKRAGGKEQCPIHFEGGKRKRGREEPVEARESSALFTSRAQTGEA